MESQITLSPVPPCACLLDWNRSSVVHLSEVLIMPSVTLRTPSSCKESLLCPCEQMMFPGKTRAISSISGTFPDRLSKHRNDLPGIAAPVSGYQYGGSSAARRPTYFLSISIGGVLEPMRSGVEICCQFPHMEAGVKGSLVTRHFQNIPASFEI